MARYSGSMAGREITTTTTRRKRKKTAVPQAAPAEASRDEIIANLSELAKAPLDPPDTELEEPNYVQLSAIMFGLALAVFGLTIWILFDIWALLLIVLAGAVFVTLGIIHFS